MKRAFIVLAAIAALGATAGCGSSDGGATTSAADSTEAWASGVCTAITTWQASIRAAIDTVTNDPSRATLEAAVGDAKTATSSLEQQLTDLGTPETQSGQAAKEALDQLSTDLADDVGTIEDAFAQVSSVSGVRGAVATVGTALANMGTQISATFKELQGLDAGDDLKQAFADATACDSLRSNS